jgi:energy-coupling factor transport system substrate-specific component
VRGDGGPTRWTTREIVVGAVLGVAVGVVFWAWGLLWSTAFQAVPFPASYLLVGLWMMGGLLVPYVVRRPGAALLGELVAAFVSMLLGNQWGLVTMLNGLVEGVGAELVFGAFRWRRYSLPVMLAAGALAGVLNLLLVDSFFYGYWQAYTGNAIVVGVVMVAISGALLGGLASKLLGDALARTGVLAGLGISRNRQRG